MRMTKIRLKTDGVVELAWEETNGQDVVSSSMTSRDGALPEFTEAVENLKGDYLHILGLPKGVGKNISMTGVSVHESKNKARGFVLTAKLVTPGGGTVGIPTPRVAEPAEDEESDGDSRLTAAQVERIESVLSAAVSFVEGDRVQRQLELEGETEEEAEPAGAAK